MLSESLVSSAPCFFCPNVPAVIHCKRLCPIFCLAAPSSPSPSLYLSLISPPLTFQIYSFPLPPDKATIVLQMLFNMERLPMSLCRAAHRPKLGHLLPCFAQLRVLCATNIVLNNQYGLKVTFQKTSHFQLQPTQLILSSHTQLSSQPTVHTPSKAVCVLCAK